MLYVQMLLQKDKGCNIAFIEGEQHCIEAKQLVTELATVSCRVLGPEHNITVEEKYYSDNVKNRMLLFCLI